MVFDLIKDEIAYFIQCQYYAWKGILTYRANALLWLLTSSFSVITAFVTISVVYNVSSGIVGWNYYQMLFLAATGTVVFWATYYLINPWSIVQGLQRGGIDIYLARPYRRLSIILSGNYSNAANVSVIGGMILLTFAALHIRFTPWFLAGYAVLLVAGAAAMVLFILMLTLLAYHLMKSARSVQSLLNLSRSISTYP